MRWVFAHVGEIVNLLGQHVLLAVPPIIVAFVLSIPIGLLVARGRRSRARIARAGGSTVVVVMGLIYAIPSLALFSVLPALLGVDIASPLNLEVALTLYGLALMVRSAADAIGAVAPAVLQSATALGFSPVQRFFRVTLPLAAPVLGAGLRVVAVSTISLVTVGAALGIESLGALFTDGFARGIPEEIGAGIVMTVVLALVLDCVIVLVMHLSLPWAKSVASATGRSRRRRPIAELSA